MILESFACSAFALTEFTKTQHYSLEENSRQKILEDGLYHFTSKEAANSIVSKGVFRPTKGRIANHLGKDKVYMFAGIPDFNNFAKNLPANLNPFVSGNLEFNVVRVRPDEQELSNFKERLQDSAIVYEGRYGIGKDRAEALELVIDLNEDNKCIFREKTDEEIQNGYTPSNELLEYIEKHRASKLSNGFKVLYHEVKAGLSSIPTAIPKVYRDLKIKSQRKKELKEFTPYSLNLGVKKGQEELEYKVNCDSIEFYGDKKLNRVTIDKADTTTGEKSTYECYMDNHILNLGEEVAAVYLSRIEDAMKADALYRANGIYYAGEPILDYENEGIAIGVDAKFNELLKERQYADIRSDADKMLEDKIREYYKKHPIKNFLNKRAVKKGKVPLLPDRSQIGKYTNEKMSKFSMEDNLPKAENSNGFELDSRIDFEYENGSKYSALIGETVEVNGKKLRKLIVAEEENYLTKNAMDTVKLPQNYYIEDMDFKNINSKDLTDLLSNLEFLENSDEIKIEDNGFVGKYVGGVIVNKKRKNKS